jgi:hypothetical protein
LLIGSDVTMKTFQAGVRIWALPSTVLATRVASERQRGAESLAVREIIEGLCYGNRMGPEYMLGAWQAAQRRCSAQPARMSNQEGSHKFLCFSLPVSSARRGASELKREHGYF